MGSALLLSPWLIGYKTGMVSNAVAKEKVFTHLFRGMEEDVFLSVCKQYSTKKLHEIIRDDALKRLLWHEKQGHDIYIVTASFEEWVAPYFEAKGIPVIGTRAEIANGLVTGKFATPNCYGPEKARRIREVLDPDGYVTIYAYGDSAGDREMFELAHVVEYRPFRV